MPTDSHLLQPAWLNAQCTREGRYVIGPLLGRGGMGDVHEAWDVVLCRTVALKVLKAIEPAALIRFMHEAQIHARVVHPNICRIYDVDNYEGSLRVAMQLVRGSNLEQACGELSVHEVVSIMALVAQAVHVVHRLNLVHRDLKPSNILLERNAEGEWTPFVCDFGLAVALDEPALTFTQGVIGTPAYMAPEQLHGNREQISPATDVYALGGTLCYALTGRPPGHRGKKVPAPGDPAIPKDLRAIIAKCLEQDPDLRYATASALAEDLWRFQQGVPLQSSNDRPLTRLLLRAVRQSRNWLLILAGCGLTAALWAAHQAQARSADRRQMELAQELVLRTEEQAGEFRQELMLPAHDLEPSYARIRGRIELDRRLMQSLAPRWQAQGHFALGCASSLVRDFVTAKFELEQAVAGGFHDPEVGVLLAWATIAVSEAKAEAALFDPGLPAAASSGMDEISLRQALEGGLDASQGAMLAFLGKDYGKAAGISHAAFMAAPWHWEAAVLESISLRSMGRKEQDAGNLAKARTRYGEGMAAARAALAVGQSDPALYHAYFSSARALAGLDLECGYPLETRLPELQVTSDQALRLNTTDPELQDDWLAVRMLKVWRLLLVGQDPEPELAAARSFLETRAQEPFTTRLRVDRMLIYWQTAEREFRLGGDPGPALTEALKTSGHTPFLVRDFLWEVLNFKARVDAARGADPRPTLDTALNHIQPLQQGVPWSLKETFASTWLIRAEWEAGHGLDPALSLRNARILAESAQSQNPDSGSGYALEGLALVQEMKAFPRERPRLRPMAQARLEQALARGASGPNQILLKRALAQLPR
jgi:serine/threonine-protein kinase